MLVCWLRCRCAISCLRLAEEPAFFVPRWSADILRELRSTLRKFGYSDEQADRRLAAMGTAFEDAEVTGYQCLQSAMTNHPKDRHVLAAAVRCGAHAIISDNKKDFPEDALAPYDLDCLTSDEFLVHQFHLAPEMVIDKLLRQAKKRSVSLVGLLMRLRCCVRAWLLGRRRCPTPEPSSGANPPVCSPLLSRSFQSS